MKKVLCVSLGCILVLTALLCIAGFGKNDVSYYWDELQQASDKNAYFNSLPTDIQIEIIKRYYPEEWEFLNQPTHSESVITYTKTIDNQVSTTTTTWPLREL